MGTLVWLSSEGRPIEPANAKISVFDRGFLYGDSIYETLRTAGGRPVEWEQHLERLRRSADGIALDLPFSDADLHAAVFATLDGAANPESRIRIVVTRGAGKMMLDMRASEAPLLVVYVQPLEVPPPEAYQRGLSVVIVAMSKGPIDPALKTGNYLANILALWRAAELSGDDAILCSAEGLVTEGASSNVFACIDGRLQTPSLASGLLHGITRGTVLKLARDLGLPVEETTISPAALREAEEVFLTSSVRGVMAVTKIDGRPVTTGPGPMTRRVMAAYDSYLDAWSRGLHSLRPTGEPE